MKKLISILLAIALSLALLTACGVDAKPVSGISDEVQAALEEMGIPMEEFEQMSEEQRAAILAELGFVYGTEEEENQKETEPAKKKPTLSDVHGEGNYRVWIGDSMWWNYYYFYFEDGKLVKIECFFQKSDGEPVEEYVFEGDTLDDFWYIDMSIEELIQYFEDNGYGYDYSVSRTD